MSLVKPLQVGKIAAPNRIFMAPLTRCRSVEYTHVPTPLMAEYYAQRAGAGLLIAEATMVADKQSGFGREPGVYSAEQVAGWKAGTDAVHAKGGRIVLQIWHGGRAAVPENSHGEPAIAPSAVGIEGHQVGAEFNLKGEKIPYSVPREMTADDIAGAVRAFAAATTNALEAGFDGVEVHAANGYLIHQFLDEGSNKRTDAYGGSLENRARFLLEVLDAVIGVAGADRVGIRLSPLNSFNGMVGGAPEELTTYLAKAFEARKLAYLHMMRADFFGVQKGDVLSAARAAFSGPLVANMGYTLEEAEAAVADGAVDAVAFGTKFLANPALVERYVAKKPLNAPNPATFYTQGAAGYTDYPVAA